MSLFSDLFGGDTTTKTVDIPASQQAEMNALSKFKTEQLLPYYMRGMKGAEDIYNINAPGVLQAAQNVAGTAGQVQETTGGVGESALRTGVSGLQSLFNPAYEQMQVQAALAPAQANYLQNVRQTGRQQAGSGTARGARAAMLNRMSANQARAQQAQLAAQISQGIAGQRQNVGNQLAQIGYGGMDRALAAAQAKLAAAQTPEDRFYKNLAARYSIGPTIGATPYPGQQGGSTQTSPSIGSIIGKALPFFL